MASLLALFSVVVATLAATSFLLIPARLVVSRDGTGPDDLLRRFPLSGPFELSSGNKVPVPFHAFDGHATILAGPISLDFAKSALRRGAGGRLQPVVTSDGYALAQMWVMDYATTGIGPYAELVFTIIAVENAADDALLPCKSTDPACGPYAANMHSHAVRTFAHRLWLDRQVAVEYGREILGTDKTFAPDLTHTVDADGSVTMKIPGVLDITVRPQTALATLTGVLPGLLRLGGVRRVVSLLVNPVIDSQLACPAGIASGFKDHAPVSVGVTVNDPDATMNVFDTSKGDSIQVRTDELKGAKFSPTVVQQIKHVRFAITNPINAHAAPVRG